MLKLLKFFSVVLLVSSFAYASEKPTLSIYTYDSLHYYGNS